MKIQSSIKKWLWCCAVWYHDETIKAVLFLKKVKCKLFYLTDKSSEKAAQ